MGRLSGGRAHRAPARAAGRGVFQIAVEWAAVHKAPAAGGDTFWVYGNEVPLGGEGVVALDWVLCALSLRKVSERLDRRGLVL